MRISRSTTEYSDFNDSDCGKEWLSVYGNVGGFQQFGGQTRRAFNLMQVPIRILAATLTVTNIDEISSTGGAHLGLLE